MCYQPYIRYKTYDSQKYILRPLVPILDTLKKIGIKERNFDERLNFMYPHHQIISCGQCLECKKRRSNEWTSRLLMEFQTKNNIGMMLTLTYDDDKLNCYNDLKNCPYRGVTLIKRDVQNFIKRLRKKISQDNKNVRIKYYACGEYGSKTNRPHYHIVILGYEFSDKRTSQMIRSHKNVPLYISDELNDLWKYGLATISNITSSSLQYVSKYIQKRQYGQQAKEKYNNVLINHNIVNHRKQKYNLIIENVTDLQPEFSLMSTKTAIGYEYMLQNVNQLLSKFNFCIDKDRGRKVALPRYFSRLLEKIDLKLFECFKIKMCFYIDKINKYMIDYHYRKKCALEHFKYRFEYSPI